MSTHELFLGDLCLSGPDGDADYWFETLADGYELGSPEASRVIAQSLLRDGDVTRVARFGNRSVSLVVVARGADSAVLAEAETALSLACAGRTTLTWTPPDGFGLPTVFDVMVADFDHSFDDMAEVRPGIKERRFSLRLECLPFARSESPVTETFTPTTATIVSVDGGSATTLWSDGGGEYPLTISTATYLGDSVIVAEFATTGEDQKAFSRLQWKPASPAGMPTTAYVTLDVLWGASMTKTVGLNAFDNYPVASEQVTLGTGTYTRYYFLNPHRASGGTAATASSALTFHFKQRITRASTVTNRVGGLSSATAIGASPVLTLQARGSVRSPVSIRYSIVVGSNRTRFLCYSDPILLEGFNPAVQASWASAPDGTYVLYAVTPWTSAVAGDVLSVTVTDSASRTQTVTTRLTTETKNRALWPIGEVQLGGFDTGAAGALTLSGRRNGALTNPAGYRLFRKHPDASLTYFDTSTDAAGVTSPIASRDFRIDAPTLERPRGGVFIDGVSAFHKADPWEFPMIVPPVTALYIEDSSTGTALPTTATYYPLTRFHSGD